MKLKTSVWFTDGNCIELDNVSYCEWFSQPNILKIITGPEDSPNSGRLYAGNTISSVLSRGNFDV